MKKKNQGIRTLVTSAVLLVLVIAGAWTLKARNEAREAQAAAAEAAAEEAAQAEAEAAAQAEAEAQAQQAAEEAAAQAQQEEAAQEQAASEAKAAYVTDYESAPLLNTTPVRYLSMEAGATEDEVRFNWMSPSGSAGQVNWTASDTGETAVFTAECAASVSEPGYYVNKASVTGLRPGVTYTYKVGNDAGGWSPEYQYTVPNVNTAEGFTFLVTSDAEIGQDQNHEMETTVEDWDKMVTRLTSYVPEAQFLIHAGDQVGAYGSAEQYGGFLDHLGLYRIPLVPVVGNHDVPNESSMNMYGYARGPYFYEHFNVPNRSDAYGINDGDHTGDYYFIRGDVLFIVLNSCTDQETDIHEEYVPQVIAEHPDTKWRIIIQHYPPYSGVLKYQEEMDPWVANSLAYICEDNDIDLVISGHDAAYSRSAFTNRKCEVYEGYDYSSGAVAVNPEGTMHVTCSTASGSIYRDASPNDKLVFQGQPYAPVALRFDVTPTELHLTAYLADSWTVYDEYTIQKT